MPILLKIILDYARDIIELILLFRIWVDGRAIRKIEQASHQLYIRYFAERMEERAKKLKQLADARAAKAAKKTEPPVA